MGKPTTCWKNQQLAGGTIIAASNLLVMLLVLFPVAGFDILWIVGS